MAHRVTVAAAAAADIIKRRMRKHILIVCCCVLAVALQAQSPERSAACLKLDILFQKLVKEKRLNGTMLVGDNEGIVYQNIAGYASISKRTPLTEMSQFEIASISKQFTAVSILMLYQRGLLSLDDSLQRFFPFFPYHGISVRQLLCHRSGLPDYFEFGEEYCSDLEPMSNDELLEIMDHYHPTPSFAPDTRFEYSNTGYALLASIVEKVTGNTFEDFVFRNIFEPLGMKNTRFYTEEILVPSAYTIGHRKNRSVYERDALSGVVGDKGVMTTAEDFYTWFFHISDILADSLLQMAWTPQNKDMSACGNYGFGWRLACDNHGSPLVYHGGLWNGNHTLVVYRPSDHAFLLFFSNCCNGAFQHRSDYVLEILKNMHERQIAAKNEGTEERTVECGLNETIENQLIK